MMEVSIILKTISIQSVSLSMKLGKSLGEKLDETFLPSGLLVL